MSEFGGNALGGGDQGGGGFGAGPQGPAGSDVPPTGGLRTGPAWEDASRDFFERLIETIKPVFASPTAFFDTLNIDRGIGLPLLFAVICGGIGGVVAGIYNIAMRSSLIALLARMGGQYAEALPNLIGTVGGGFCGILLVPVMVVIGVFIASGIAHLCLMLVGGANNPFEATFRVVAYSQALSLLNVIPFCGGLAAAIWILVVEMIGLSRVHNISVGRAALAVLLPVVLCCLCLFFGFGTLIGLIAAAGHR